MAIKGIDVSKWQGAIDFKKVATDGVKFVIVRLGWAGYDGKITANGGVDHYYHTNVKNALAAGLDVGVYVYSYAKTSSAAIVAVEETIQLLVPYKGKINCPVVFDLEDPIEIAALINKLDRIKAIAT